VTPVRGQAYAPAKLLLDAVFCLILPIVLLRPHLPGLPGGLTGIIGPVPAYLTASLIPVTYILIGLLRHRHANTLTLMAAGSAVLAGALAFVPVSGVAFAVKDSSGSLFLLAVTTASLLLGRPFAAALLRVTLMPDTPGRAARLDALLQEPTMTRAVVTATRVLQLKAVTVASLNILVKVHIVTAPFGTGAFNAQLADATARMIPLAWLASAVSYPAVTALLARALRRQTGVKTLPLGRAFWHALEHGSVDDTPSRSGSAAGDREPVIPGRPARK